MKPLLLSAVGLLVLVVALALWLARDDAAPVELEPDAPAAIEADSVARVDEPLVEPIRADEARAEEMRTAIAPVASSEPTATVASDDAPRARVHGRLTDVRTGEPLPQYLFQLEDAHGGRLPITTNQDGTFESEHVLAAGDLAVRWLDHAGGNRGEQKHVRFELDPAGEPLPLELAVASGPTFGVLVMPNDGPAVENLRVRLRWNGAENNGRSDNETLRAGEPMWVRFAALPAEAQIADALEVRSRDGLWTGESHVEALRGVVPGVVAVRLEQRAALAGRVVDVDGNPIEAASVTLVVSPSVGGPQRRQATTKADGRYRFEFQRAGTAVVGARTLRHSGAHVDLTLEAGHESTADIVLTPRPPAGAIRGVVMSDTGGYEGKVSLRLRSTDPQLSGLESQCSVHYETRADRRVGVFEFAALPTGTYTLDVIEEDWFQWEPRSVRVDAPREAIEFRVHDAVQIADLAFLVRDVNSGRPIEPFHVALQGQVEYQHIDALSGRVAVPGFPLEYSLAWRLDANGYPSQFGTLSSFAVESIVAGRARRTCELDLAPGWGERFRVLQRGNNRPIAGVTLWIDGNEAGKTDGQGYLRIVTAQKPADVAFTWRDWHVDGNIDLRPASQRAFPLAQRVWMTGPPPPKKN